MLKHVASSSLSLFCALYPRAHIHLQVRTPMTVHPRMAITPEEISSVMKPLWNFMMRNLYEPTGAKKQDNIGGSNSRPSSASTSSLSVSMFVFRFFLPSFVASWCPKRTHVGVMFWILAQSLESSIIQFVVVKCARVGACVRLLRRCVHSCAAQCILRSSHRAVCTSVSWPLVSISCVYSFLVVVVVVVAVAIVLDVYFCHMILWAFTASQPPTLFCGCKGYHHLFGDHRVNDVGGV